MKSTEIKTGKSKISKGITKICSQLVEWHLNGKSLALSAIDIEQITNALIDNRLDGELYSIAPNGQTVGGRWSIQW